MNWKYDGVPPVFFSSDRHVYKIAAVGLRKLEAEGGIRIWNPDQVHDAMSRQTSKLANQANDVRHAMKRNNEILIEGTIPGGLIIQIPIGRRG